MAPGVDRCGLCRGRRGGERRRQSAESPPRFVHGSTGRTKLLQHRRRMGPRLGGRVRRRPPQRKLLARRHEHWQGRHQPSHCQPQHHGLSRGAVPPRERPRRGWQPRHPLRPRARGCHEWRSNDEGPPRVVRRPLALPALRPRPVAGCWHRASRPGHLAGALDASGERQERPVPRRGRDGHHGNDQRRWDSVSHIPLVELLARKDLWRLRQIPQVEGYLGASEGLRQRIPRVCRRAHEGPGRLCG
mmetsp:Transcript_52358/g.150901  ORF Transcript_52358/g.150901 Transcript_52358/m.150901 type:complete len:245 (+) Transcript_52358:80-814(+)